MMSDDTTYQQPTLLSAASLASHTVTPGSDEARQMTEISGRNISELLPNSHPLGWLVKTFLASELPCSTTSYLTWKVQATPSKRLIFQLSHSMPDTSGTDYSLWPTPKANEPGMSAKTDTRGVEKSTHLTTQVALAEGMINRETGKLWRTPQAANATQGPKSAEKYERSLKTGESSITLTDQVRHEPSVWAAPQARDCRTGQQSRWENPERSRNLNDQAAQESSGQLNPQWVEWLMGFPIGYSDLGD
jgi:hypothetical protein